MIWQHLRNKVGISVEPIMMDGDTYLRYESYGHSFSENYARKLSQLLDKEEYSVFHNVIRLMLKKRKRLEQEAVAVLSL